MLDLAKNAAPLQAILLLSLALAACSPPRPISSEDSARCQAQGFAPGTDPLMNCVRKLEAERLQAGGR